MRKSLFLYLTLFISAVALPVSAQRLLGGDISLLPSYESNSIIYKNIDGKTVNPLRFFHQQGWNAMRVRLFVEPRNASAEHKGEGVCQDLPYVLNLCRRIKKAGFKLMLDFHYSDTWADPAKQFTPRSWEKANAEELADSVYNYTKHALNVLVAGGATPDLIQVGNEISFGMLWPLGRIDPMKEDNWNVFTDMLKSGTRACREVCPKAKIIIHTERAGEWETTKNYYQRIKAHNVDYDIIGLSYYPMWHKSIPVLGGTLDSLATDFPDKKVMVVETAFYYSHDNDIWTKDKNEFADLYPVTPEGQRIFTAALVDELQKHDNVDGLFWWFPEENAFHNSTIKSWINRGLFDNKTGKALPALYEMKRFLR
jgi:arabinogalactan endo-1,4-beta-galactosidase